ncbi:MAG: DNA mismatch repair protein MutS [Bacteroides sp.]|nr:DNA mismatch repair protein MutS [Bacillota bacterium]MCM1455832.1 DNA mismatch repair protein MutS [Bacteroides sp.]
MIIDFEKLSPMMKRYFQIKEQYPDCLLFFRLGDFYEMFFEHAETASRVLDLTLTGRDCGLEERAPMCGVPYHAVDTYIRRLIDAGYRVAICEQLSDPATTKGLVDRDVVRVISSGTVMEDEILDEKKSNYLLSVYSANDAFGIAWTDISTGEFCVYEYKGEDYLDRLSDFIGSISPAEVICNDKFLSEYQKLQYFKSSDQRVRCYYDFAYSLATATKKILSAFNVSSLIAFECDDKPNAVSAAGGLLEYLAQTQKRSLGQLSKISLVRDKSFMMLDSATRRNLELTSRARDGKRQGSLLWVLDKTKTAMGARTVRHYIEKPLQDAKQINKRLDAVEELVGSRLLRERISDALTSVRDLERLNGKLAYGNATPKDLLSISDTLSSLPSLKSALKEVKTPLLKEIAGGIYTLDALNKTLIGAIDRDAVNDYKNKPYIKVGYNKQYDSFRNIRETAKNWLAELEAREKEETGIRTLKISYNKIFGYYIEVSKSFIDKVPYRYQRKQTLVNAERFITDELKQIEDKVLNAEASVQSIEAKIFFDLKELCIKNLAQLQSTAHALSTLDALLSFATVSVAGKYVKPNIGDKVRSIDIRDGRHPVVEQLIDKGSYVPNDTLLDGDENRTMIITGPNMAGKSTYMRQVAIITLMAHIGCFVPAKSADIALTDRIFTRIGASDDLSSGQSTFMVEMIEVATILNYATGSSLLILDEIGRGTSTFDGLSIAWAVLEYITKNLKAKTLFATHFHELTELDDLEGIKNYRVLISQTGENIVFLHKIASGGASQSFGVEVASLAGVCKPVIDRAKNIMHGLEADSKRRDTNGMLLSSAKDNVTEQIGLFDTRESKIERQIRDTDVNNLTPLQALTILTDLKKQLDG